MKTTTAEIALDRIKEDPALTPEVLDIKKHLSLDKDRIEKYLTIVSELNFKEFIKVWHYNGQHILIDNYEYLCALLEHHKKDPSHKVSCLVIEEADHREVKELSFRLRNLHPTDSHTARCLNLYTLKEMGCSLIEIKRLYSVKKSHSAEGKKLQRDYRIVRHAQIFNRVMGLADQWASPSVVAELKIPKPPIYKATLSYALADKILSILPAEDEEMVSIFVAEYDKYLQTLKEAYTYEEEQTKPIYTWKNYSRDRVLKIARAIARGTEIIPANSFLISGDDSRHDYSWGIHYNENSNDLKFPQVTLNLASKKENNLKKVVELRYKLETLSHSLSSYIKRIAPADHGIALRVKDAGIEPALDTVGNMSRFADRHYFEYIRGQKLLYYCNRELLLRSINLKAHNFGFPRYDHNSETSYHKANESFSKWHEQHFNNVVKFDLGGSAERHSNYPIYHAIKIFLSHKAGSHSAIYFCDFILETFSFVFRELDKESENKKKTTENFIASRIDINPSQLSNIVSILAKQGLKPEDAAEVARGLVTMSMSAAEENAAKNLKAERDQLSNEIHRLREMLRLRDEENAATSKNVHSPLYEPSLIEIAEDHNKKKRKKA